LRQFLDRLVELDFTAPVAFAALTIVYIASRIYWLDLGYGTDPDAWRVAMTANYLWQEGEYLPSRLPGYPLHELLTALGIRGGWVWTNFSTVIASLAGVYLFANLAKKLELPHRGALVLAFAFSPLLWINSVATMDYMWALTFILAAYLALLYGQTTVAGLCLGIAGGFRLTSLFMLPVFLLFLWRNRTHGQARAITFTAIATVLVVFTPVLMEYGVGFLNFYDEQVVADEFIKRLAKDGLGIIGTLTLVVALVVSLPRLKELPRDLRSDSNVLVWVSAIVIFFVSYTRLPHEIAYLLPLFPFGFFLMARYFSRTVLLASIAALLFAGFVDITSPDDATGIDRTTITSARIGRGMLFSDIETLRDQMSFARELREVTTTNPNMRKPALVIVGFIYPELVTIYKDDLKLGVLEKDHGAISQLSDKGLARDEENEINYVWLLDFDSFQFYRDQGWTVYTTADARRSTYALYGYRPGYFGAIELPVGGDIPPWRKTSPTDR
jgi:MFS family permease